jgi:hypothetical protein
MLLEGHVSNDLGVRIGVNEFKRLFRIDDTVPLLCRVMWFVDLSSTHEASVHILVLAGGDTFIVLIKEVIRVSWSNHTHFARLAIKEQG